MKKTTRAKLLGAGLKLLLPAVPPELQQEALLAVKRAREIRARRGCSEEVALLAAFLLNLTDKEKKA